MTFSSRGLLPFFNTGQAIAVLTVSSKGCAAKNQGTGNQSQKETFEFHYDLGFIFCKKLNYKRKGEPTPGEQAHLFSTKISQA